LSSLTFIVLFPEL